MFDLDIAVINYIYGACLSLGKAFKMGAFEGAVIYSSVIVLVWIKATEKKV